MVVVAVQLEGAPHHSSLMRVCLETEKIRAAAAPACRKSVEKKIVPREDEWLRWQPSWWSKW